MIDPPKTAEEAAKVVYGHHWCRRRWDSARCAYEVYPQERGDHPHQCNFRPGHGPSELYCKRHAKIVGGGK